MRLRDKVAIVTGGGAGVGRATALRFAQEGCAVVIADIDPASADAATAAIKEAGGRSIALKADVANVDQGRAVVEKTLSEFGALDILVNNAGLPSQYNKGTALEIWDLGIEQSLSGPFRMSEAAIPHLIQRPSSAIINICSIAGTKTGMPIPWYASAKAGITGLTKHQATTYGPQGLRANALCLGPIMTQRTAFIRENPEALAAMINRTPIGRFGEPEEVANAALFLASDEASLITGQVLIADGGFTIG